MMDADGAIPGDGTRDQKRRETHERIAREGIRLFLKQGFEETTVDQIATAAKISRRTFFHYFESKEDIVFGSHQQMEQAVISLLNALPQETSPLQAVETVLMRIVGQYETPEALAVGEMIRNTPSLMARKQADYEHQERMLFDALNCRWPEQSMRMPNRLAALNAMGLVRICCETTQSGGANCSLSQCLQDGFEILRKQLGAN